MSHIQCIISNSIQNYSSYLNYQTQTNPTSQTKTIPNFKAGCHHQTRWSPRKRTISCPRTSTIYIKSKKNHSCNGTCIAAVHSYSRGEWRVPWQMHSDSDAPPLLPLSCQYYTSADRGYIICVCWGYAILIVDVVSVCYWSSKIRMEKIFFVGWIRSLSIVIFDVKKCVVLVERCVLCRFT